MFPVRVWLSVALERVELDTETEVIFAVVANGRTVNSMGYSTSNSANGLMYMSYDSGAYMSHTTIDDRIREALKRLAPPEYTALKCRECGGQITQKWDDHIVKCPYCKTVYVVGRKMING